MTNYDALRLAQEINHHVKAMAAEFHIDLNSIDKFTDTMIIVGEEKTGLILHVRQHGAVNDTKAGVYVTAFNAGGHTISHVNVEGVTL